MKKLLLSAFGSLLFVPAAHAVCPVCTVTIGGVMIGARSLGINEVLIGIWAGGLALSIVFWAWNVMKKRDIHGLLFLLPPVFAAGLLSAIYMAMTMFYDTYCFWGINQYLLGVMIGIPTFIAATLWHLRIKKQNGGQSWFPLQKVVWPVGALAIMTAIFAVIMYT